MSFLSGLFNKAKGMVSNFLGKNPKIGGLVNKAKEFVGNVSNIYNNKNVKNLADSVSKFMPSVGDFYNKGKKYANMADNFINKGGFDKAANRYLKKIENSIEKTPDKNYNKSEDFMGLFS